ncbi:hypothetical protein IC230_04265 [Spirosoma sp. BT704]|uniref:Uncharacterized protein n=2 Tax=Spirosoma validum TaxID=2771355 RepID=A0A927GC29_9BACT|nr:hypothetical protein [Spirosoma validum]
MVKYLRILYQIITKNAYLIIWCSVGIFSLVTLYVRSKVIFLVNPDIGGVESNVIYSVLRMLAGFPLYQNPEQAPYAITQYSPIYYYLTVGVSRLVGLTADDVYDVYAVGRCISLVANVFYVWGIVWLARRLQLTTSVAILVGLLAFILLPPQSYGRPDSLYNALVIWTLWAVLGWISSDSAKSLVYGAALTACLAALALFSKQSGLCLPIIIGGYLIFVSPISRQIFPFLGWYALFIGLLYYSLFWQDATLIYANVIQGVSNGIDLANFKHNLVDHYLRPFAWLVIPSLAISIRYSIFEQGARQFIGLSVLGLFLFAMATGLKWGSALNYFTEFTGLSFLLIADTIRLFRSKLSDWANVGRLALLLAVIWVVPVNAMNFNWERSFNKPVDMTQYQQEQAVAQYVKNELTKHNNGLVYSTLYNSSYLNAFLFRHCIVPQQDLMIGSAYPLRSFDYTDLDRAAQDGRVQFVISRNGETDAPLSPPVYLGNYRPIKSIGDYTIYKFNPSAGQLSDLSSEDKAKSTQRIISPSLE